MRNEKIDKMKYLYIYVLLNSKKNLMTNFQFSATKTNNYNESVPIFMVDNSYSTNGRVLRTEFAILKNMCKDRNIEQIYLMCWSDKFSFPNGENLVDIKSIRPAVYEADGGTELCPALKNLPIKWYENNKSTNIFIITDGEITDEMHGGECELKNLFLGYVEKNFNFHIVTVDDRNNNYIHNNCTAGTQIYKLFNKLFLMKQVKLFISYNNYHTEGYINLSNPNVPEGFLPFRDQCFEIKELNNFIAYLELLIDEVIKQDNFDQSRVELLKIAHDLTITLYHLVKNIDDSMLKSNIAQTRINLFSSLFVNTMVYRDVREMLLKEVEKHSSGQSTTFQEYRNTREAFFDKVQQDLFKDTKSAITYGHSPQYVTFPIMLENDNKIVHIIDDNMINYEVKLDLNVYKRAGVKIHDFIVPALPLNVVSDDNICNQSIRQWIRANYSKKYNVPVTADLILYYFLTDVLCISLSDADQRVKDCYKNLGKIMLQRERYGTNIKEIDYLKDGHLPTLMKDKIKEDTTKYIFQKCMEFLGHNTVNSYAVWYGITLALNDQFLSDVQLSLCKSELDLNGTRTNDEVIEYLKTNLNSSLIRVINSSKNAPIKLEYHCFITFEDTSLTGGYNINPHRLSKSVICRPQYVISPEGFKYMQAHKLSCPICYKTLTENDYTFVLSEIENNNNNNNNNKDDNDNINKYELHKKHEECYNALLHEDIIIDLNHDNITIKTLDECNLKKPHSYSFNLPVIYDSLHTVFLKNTTQAEFNNYIKTHYSFLDGINFNKHNSVIMGGFCRSALTGKKFKDLDVFLHTKDHNKNMLELAEIFTENIKKQYPNTKFLMAYKPLNNVFEINCVDDPTDFFKEKYCLDNFKQYAFDSLRQFDKKLIINTKDKTITKRNKVLKRGWKGRRSTSVQSKKIKYDNATPEYDSDGDCSDEINKLVENRDFSNYFEDGDKHGIKMHTRIQFVMIEFESITDLIKTVDFRPCQIFYDGETTYLTNHAEQAYRYMINVVNEEKYSFMFNSRLIKYMIYGFAPVLPNLNIKLVSNKRILILDTDIKLDVKNVEGNIIIIEHNSSVKKELQKLQELEEINLRKGKFLYKSMLYCSLVSLLRYIKINNIPYKFTTKFMQPNNDGMLYFRESRVKLQFIKQLHHVQNNYDWYGSYRSGINHNKITVRRAICITNCDIDKYREEDLPIIDSEGFQMIKSGVKNEIVISKIKTTEKYENHKTNVFSLLNNKEKINDENINDEYNDDLEQEEKFEVLFNNQTNKRKSAPQCKIKKSTIRAIKRARAY